MRFGNIVTEPLRQEYGQLKLEVAKGLCDAGCSNRSKGDSHSLCSVRFLNGHLSVKRDEGMCIVSKSL